MIHYHPDVRFLTDFAAGSLPKAQALCVASHLHYCASCRTKVRELTELGAELFCQQTPAAVMQSEFERVLQKLPTTNAALGSFAKATEPAQAANNDATPTEATLTLPRPLQGLANGNVAVLPWRRIGKNFRFCQLRLGDKQRETTLFFIKAGGAVPHHRHRGDEITVILKGSFSDHEDKYNVGDFIVRTSGESHRPVASQDQDCLCLSTLDAPIVMSNWLVRAVVAWLNWRALRQQVA